MDRIYKTVVEAYKIVNNNNFVKENISGDTLLINQFELDSFTFMSMIVDIEDKLQIDLDNILIELSNCKTLNEFINYIKNLF